MSGLVLEIFGNIIVCTAKKVCHDELQLINR